MKKEKKLTAEAFFGGRPFNEMTREEQYEAYINMEKNALKAFYQAGGYEVERIDVVPRKEVTA